MAKKRTSKKSSIETTHFTYDEKRTHIPPSRIAGHGKYPHVEKPTYAYNPHLSPQVRIDPTAESDRYEKLVEASATRPLTPTEVQTLRDGLKQHHPWLEWAGKREAETTDGFSVDPVVLHVHERVSPEAVVRSAMRKDIQRDLFGDTELSYQDSVKFYQYEVGWANRLILGDSLEVMSSLSRRERLAGRVQMIYVDPPYGLSFNTNWQIETSKPKFDDAKDETLTREVEQIKAYRDTWRLGIHSYLAYLKKRLVVAHELLNESGSIFVQISDDHVHRVRAVLDEVFGPENFISEIVYQKTTGFQTNTIASLYDYILWYGKNKQETKVHQLYERQEVTLGKGNARWLLFPDGSYRGVSKEEEREQKMTEEDVRLYSPDNLQSQGGAAEPQTFVFQGKPYTPDASHHWKGSYPAGMTRLAEADRIHVARDSLRYRRFHTDFPHHLRGNLWTDTITGSFTEKKLFVVQTSPKVVERCIALSTDPGDLVLDPTCGSGTTPIAAEELGRRWIAIDTSRVALHIARMRVLTASFQMFKTKDGGTDPSVGLVYQSAPHIKLETIARDANIDAIVEKYAPQLEHALQACNQALARVTDATREKLRHKLRGKQKAEGKKAVTRADHRRWELPKQWQHWNVPLDTDPDWPTELTEAVQEYYRLLTQKRDEIDQSIANSASHEEFFDSPEPQDGVARVAGPFTVEGIMPAENLTTQLSVAEKEPAYGLTAAARNHIAYLDAMVRHIRADGLTFVGNENRKLAWVEELYTKELDSTLHAEAAWSETGSDLVGIGFGPQHGPVTAALVEEFIRASALYTELVVAGFSFDPEASQVIRENSTKKLRIHQAHIRPDINPSIQGLLREPANMQLFSVFGEPQIAIAENTKDEFTVLLQGVDIYDPMKGEVRSSGARKVAAWFLDADYDGRTFCVTQAFFPDQDAWSSIAKDLKVDSDDKSFAAYSGTQSLPFKEGRHAQVAVKVIDPRGNEVMTTAKLRKGQRA